MSRQKMVILPDRIYRVTKADEPPLEGAYRPGSWPRALAMFVEMPDGSWRVRLRCPDGAIRRFRSRRTVAEDRTGARQPISPRTRFRILARDGFRCRYCGRGAPEIELHVDHVVAVVNGGTTEDDNLVAACADCNLGKAAS